MESAVNERIRLISEKFGKSVRNFAINAGIPPTSLNEIIRNNADPKMSTIEKILNAVPSVSSDWLLTGSGRMIRDTEERFSNNSVAVNEIKGIPLYRTEAAAGFGSSDFSISEKDIESVYRIKELEKQTSFMLHVHGQSMEPVYNNGDIVALKKIENEHDIQWGKAHCVSSSEHGILLKYIYDYGEFIMAVSENTSYKPYLINKSDIKGIAIVVGCVKLENY